MSNIMKMVVPKILISALCGFTLSGCAVAAESPKPAAPAPAVPAPCCTFTLSPFEAQMLGQAILDRAAEIVVKMQQQIEAAQKKAP